MLSYWFNFIQNNDPNYMKVSSESDYWQPFVKDLAKLSADEKMKKGNYFLFANSAIKMTSDFSSHKCKFWNFTQNPPEIPYKIPNFIEKILIEFKYFFASLF